MVYTTFIENGYKPDAYDNLEFAVNWVGKGISAYVLAIKNSGGVSEEKIKKITSNLDNIERVISVNGYIDVVIKGNNHEGIANKIHNETKKPLGIVKYNKHNMGKLYCELSEAVDIAEEQRKPYHLYNPKKDSVEALVNKALTKLNNKN